MNDYGQQGGQCTGTGTEEISDDYQRMYAAAIGHVFTQDNN